MEGDKGNKDGGNLGKENGDRPPIFGLNVAVWAADLTHPKILAWRPLCQHSLLK